MATTLERERNPARSRAAILDAAERLFAEKGYEATSLSEVGTAAGLSRATPGYFLAVLRAAAAFASRRRALRASSRRLRRRRISFCLSLMTASSPSWSRRLRCARHRARLARHHAVEPDRRWTMRRLRRAVRRSFRRPGRRLGSAPAAGRRAACRRANLGKGQTTVPDDDRPVVADRQLVAHCGGVKTPARLAARFGDQESDRVRSTGDR